MKLLKSDVAAREQETMMRRGLGMLSEKFSMVGRLALVAVFVAMFCMAGAVSNANAANVTYHMRGVAAQSVGVDGNTNVVAEGRVTYSPIVGTQYRAIMSKTASTSTSRNRFRQSASWSGWEQFLRMYTPVYSPGMNIGANATVSWDMYSAAGADVYAEMYEYNDSTGIVGALKGTTNTLNVSSVPSHNILTFDNASFTVATGNRLVIYYYLNGNNTDPRPIFGAAAYNSGTPAGDLYLVVDETAACSDTNGSSVTLTDPTNGGTVTGSLSIATTLNNAATVEYSIDGGAWTSDANLWNTLVTHPTSNSAPVAGVTVDVRAIEDECGGYVTDSITVTVDNTCTESTQSSIIWNGTNTAAGDFSGASFVTLTDVNTLEYQVTEGSGPGTPFEELEYFDTADDVCDYSSWTASAFPSGNCGGTFDAGTAGGQLYVYNSGQSTNGTTLTGSAGTGPTSLHSGTSPPGGFLFIEASGTGPYNATFTRNAAFDANTYEPNISYAFQGWGGNLISLAFEVNDGSGWTTEWILNGADANNDGSWQTADINLNNGTISIDGGAYASTTTVGGTGTAYTSGSLQMRFVFDTNNFAGDYALDTIRVYGNARATETTVIPWTTDTIAASGVLTNGNSYNLYARGLDTECGVAYYGDSVAQPVSPGTSQTFTWSACTETATLTLNPITDPITGDVTVTASGTATGITVGTSPAAGNANGWLYVPAQDDNTTVVNFYATGTGTCGPLSASQLNVSTNTMAAPTVTAFSVPATVIDTAAPLDVPVDVFTATDNVAVTGYQITIDNPAAPAAAGGGWTASAPTSVTVPGYASYTLYAWAKDAAGNVSAASTASVTVQNCVPGTINFDPASIAQPVTAATLNFGAYASVTDNLPNSDLSNLMYSVNGSPYVAVSTVYTMPVAFSGTINVKFKADDTCSGTVYLDNGSNDGTGPGFSLTVDTRELFLESNLASATQADLTSISVVMSYCNDKNGTGTFQVDYQVSGSGTWTVGTPQNDATNDGDYIITLTGLTTGEVYDVRMIYADPVDGAVAGEGATTQTVQVTLVAWADNAMLHNSNRFPGTTKHSGDWGTDTGAKGPIVCATCHDKNTGNVKRVKAIISFPDGSTMPGGGVSATVDLQSVEDGSSDFGDDSTAPRSSSNRVCEVCHTYDASQTVGVMKHAANQSVAAGHYDNSDCIKCHQHSNGFKADCTSCHGNPPLVAGDLTATLNPTNSTGSATAGKHDVHVTTQGYGCNTCHTGWEASGEMPKNGNINLGFNIALGTTTDTTGNYDGRSTGGGYKAAAGTSVTTGNGLSCSAIYCHGTATPAWTASATAACGSCHGRSPDGMPSTVAGDGDLSSATSGSQVGKHPEHVDNAGLACSTCHKDLGFGTPDHVNGAVDIWFDTALAGASATYNNATNTCSNMSCHISKVWDTVTPASCDMCHGYPPLTDGSANDMHVAGATPVDHSGANMTSKHDECNLCHGFSQANGATDNTANGGDQYLVSYHRDGNIEMNGISPPDNAQSAEYDQATFGCAKACHANDAAHQLSDSGLTVVTHEYGSGSCTGCHDGTGTGATLVNDNSPHALAATGLQCEECHGSHGGGTIEIPNNPTVGINYTANGEAGIALGVAGTAPGATEAQICWNCHDSNGISEWGTNTQAATGSSPYNYGNLTTSNWTTATWSSSRSQFAYKTGAIQSTHTANPAVTDANLAGANYSKTGTPNNVADIRCSYCHDVHELALATGDTAAGKPYLRGNWRGNPYEEDGAPRSSYAGTTYFSTAAEEFGQVPRGAISGNLKIGGYWIDQNNVVPMSATTTAQGTAATNPTATWTVDQFGGLCALCHGGGNASWTTTEVDNIDQKTGEALWMGTNGHANSVKGGTGASSTNSFNVFDARGGIAAGTNSTQLLLNNPRQHYVGTTAPGDNQNGVGFRSANSNALRYQPPLQGGNTRPYSYQVDAWTVDESGATKENQYHKFSCSKCHNPHASRLPKLMITNCLDTVHNTWDNQFQMVTASSSLNNNREMAQWTSAQNCHRYSESNNTTTASPEYRANRQASPAGSGFGWNKVTPWKQTTNTP